MKYLLLSTLNMSENLNLSSSEVSFLSVEPVAASNLASIATNIAHTMHPANSNIRPAKAGLAVSASV